MPLGALAEAVLQPIVEIVLQVFCYGTAWLLVPLFTCGKIDVVPTPMREFVRPKFGGVHRGPKGRYVMDAELASLIGLLFWFAVAMGAYAVHKST